MSEGERKGGVLDLDAFRKKKKIPDAGGENKVPPETKPEGGKEATVVKMFKPNNPPPLRTTDPGMAGSLQELDRLYDASGGVRFEGLALIARAQMRASDLRSLSRSGVIGKRAYDDWCIRLKSESKEDLARRVLALDNNKANTNPGYTRAVVDVFLSK